MLQRAEFRQRLKENLHATGWWLLIIGIWIILRAVFSALGFADPGLLAFGVMFWVLLTIIAIGSMGVAKGLGAVILLALMWFAYYWIGLDPWPPPGVR